MRALREKIDRAFYLEAEIRKLSAELKTLEKAIKDAALARPSEHVKLLDEEREGSQFLAEGSEITVPVVFTADAVMQTFRWQSPAHLKIAAVANGKLSRFYKEERGFKSVIEDGKLFRRVARQELGDEAGVQFVQACLARDKQGVPKNQIRIEWDRAAAAQALRAVSASTESEAA